MSEIYVKENESLDSARDLNAAVQRTVLWLTCVNVSIIRARALKDARNLKQPVRTKTNVITNQ